MRGMLVDDGDAVTGFGDDIGLVKLRPCRAKERVVQRFLPGLVNAGRRRRRRHVAGKGRLRGSAFGFLR